MQYFDLDMYNKKKKDEKKLIDIDSSTRQNSRDSAE